MKDRIAARGPRAVNRQAMSRVTQAANPVSGTLSRRDCSGLVGASKQAWHAGCRGWCLVFVHRLLFEVSST